MLSKKSIPEKFLLLLFFLPFFIGCSSNDDVKDQGKDNSETPIIGLLDKEIELPQNLRQSTDPYAQQLVYQVDFVSSFQMYAVYTQIPADASVSHTPINPTGSLSRPSGTAAINYTVYTYTYAGASIAYQFSVQDGMDVVEIFYSSPETNGYIRYMEIRQAQDGSHGTLKLLALDNQSDYLYKWTWNVNSDDSVFVTFELGEEQEVYYEMLYYPDMSGYLKIFWNGTSSMEYYWNSDGSGTWTDTDSNESGSW